MANVSDFLVERLAAWGVRRIFGYPGDGINGVMGALGRAGERFKLVRTSHEEMAAFMACAHAKFTGEVGVCVATSGPGAIHLLNGLYDAKMDHQPVVAIVGQTSRKALGGAYQQEVDLPALFRDVATYVQTVVDPAQVRHVVDRAFRIAKAERTVTCVVLPTDVQELDAVETPPRAHGTVHSSHAFSAPKVVPTDSDLQKAAEILNAGKRVAMLVGAGALHAGPEVLAVADRLDAGIAKALLGKAVVPDELPFVTGSIGLLGTKPSWDMMRRCDTLLMVGSSFPYAEFLPPEGQARGVQIDLDPKMLGLRYPMELNLAGDSAATLRALLPLLEAKTDGEKTGAWRREIASNVEEWWALLEARAMTDAKPINPQRVFWELSPRLPDNAIVSADSGSAANWFARDIKIRPGMMASLSGNLATMCPGVPYAVAAKFAHPDRVAVALMGDGAMQMLGNNGLITISRYWKEWSDPRLVVLVLNNGDLNEVTWEMRANEGDPKLAASQDLADFPYARYAEMVGLRGIRVESPDQIGAAWDAAFAADRPVVVEAITDPDVPPLPPHITLEQAKHYTSALLKGDPDEGGIIHRTFSEVVAKLLPHRARPSAPKS
ncbi:MAG TPA: thiamine pyrophosphate-requiring protein [Polyangia bacterium]|nr:thiamine pyrophosphate-requiring protein [Polyangia bacterium]